MTEHVNPGEPVTSHFGNPNGGVTPLEFTPDERTRRDGETLEEWRERLDGFNAWEPRLEPEPEPRILGPEEIDPITRRVVWRFVD